MGKKIKFSIHYIFYKQILHSVLLKYVVQWAESQNKWSFSVIYLISLEYN